MKYKVQLNYGCQYSADEGREFHAFIATDPDDQVSESIGEQLAQQLDTTVDSENFYWNSMDIKVPDSVVRKIELNYIDKIMAKAGNPQAAHEIYKLYWMIEHGFTLSDLVQELTDLQTADPEDSDRFSTPISELYQEWEDEHGFGNGSLWPCLGEFTDCEYKGVAAVAEPEQSRPLDEFIRNEVPYRIGEILDGKDAPADVVEGIIADLCANSNVMFDYDALDSYIQDKLTDAGLVCRSAISATALAKGFARGIVKLINNPNDGDVACQIGENWFYFAGQEGEGTSAKEYCKNVPLEDTINEIRDALNGLDETEYNYYAAILEEGGVL